jgi:hypothetical protein
MSNARKMYGSCIRKFNSERLKDPEVEAKKPDMLKGFMKA